ncbi:hypothetical protein R3P38DRAFT_2958102 [Favolaschia claudopus]|uniref:DUF7330 domain-containing protein n=1 Tax=Favolaschia claudopus TaxID=2862362 RepID=A0AAW0BB27_9AGAR
MILLDSSLKTAQDRDTTVNAAFLPGPDVIGLGQPEDSPPAYYPGLTSLMGSPNLRSESSQAPRSTSFLSLVRGNGQSITGSYTIDPSIRIPSALLPTEIGAEPRRNLYLETTDVPIDADVFVVGEASSNSDSEGSESLRADIELKAAQGPITARLVPYRPTLPRPHIHLTAHSASGPINVLLPPTFCGPLTIRTPSTCSLPQEAIIFAEAQDTRRGFVGDFAGWTDDSVGDALVIESAGPVVVGVAGFDDADDGAAGSGGNPLRRRLRIVRSSTSLANAPSSPTSPRDATTTSEPLSPSSPRPS